MAYHQQETAARRAVSLASTVHSRVHGPVTQLWLDNTGSHTHVLPTASHESELDNCNIQTNLFWKYTYFNIEH